MNLETYLIFCTWYMALWGKPKQITKASARYTNSREHLS